MSFTTLPSTLFVKLTIKMANNHPFIPNVSIQTASFKIRNNSKLIATNSSVYTFTVNVLNPGMPLKTAVFRINVQDGRGHHQSNRVPGLDFG